MEKKRFFSVFLPLLAVGALLCHRSLSAEEADRLVFPLQSGTLSINTDATAQLVRADGTPTGPVVSAFALIDESGKTIAAERVAKKAANAFDVHFADRSVASFETVSEDRFVLFKLVAADFQSPIGEFSLFRIATPSNTRYAWQINESIYDDGFRVALMTAAVNVRPTCFSNGGTKGDNQNCSHTFTPLARAEADPDRAFGDGDFCAEFCAQSKRDDVGGWSVRGKTFDTPLDLTGCRGIRARVFGDSNREALKIQLGGATGHRDDYITIDFDGWKTLTLTAPALNDLSYNDVRRLNFYYNGLPAQSEVRCRIDQVEAVFGEGDSERTVLLEDFESPTLAYWDSPSRILSASTYKRHSLVPAQCALIAADQSDWPDTVERMQKAANLPSPKPGGAWRDASEYVHQSYFFLTYFNVDEYDAALAFAKRGGFKQILLLQNSWCETTGHYRVNEKNFPGGIDTLRETIEKFRAEGIRFGLHFLAASIDPPDAYLTPVPDKRFVLGVNDILAADLDAESTTIATKGDATKFPTGENPYMGSGQVVRIDDELIAYGKSGSEGLSECQRGLYGTVVSSHQKGTPVAHFVRAYGYHMYDLDTDFPEEIAANFALVANALPLDMIYFDGSERLQRPQDGGDHWYYNARLHRAFFDKVNDKNILYQGSSCSPCSWHQLLRSASADGHDDLKAYLEERSGAFLSMADNNMPLDIGWYYGYDRNATPDMYEYILGATLGYDSSMSFQASVAAAMKHPFIGEILDMIRTYEELRLSGRFPAAWREKFRIDPALAGTKSVEERNALLSKRNDFHLETASDGTQAFRRIIYPLWRQIAAEEPSRTWELAVEQPCRIGLQVHFKEEGTTADDARTVRPRIQIEGEKFSETIEMPVELSRGQYAFALPGKTIARYGLPLTEPDVLEIAAPEIRLAPGKYRVTFAVENGENLPLRVRTPLYTDEVLTIE